MSEKSPRRLSDFLQDCYTLISRDPRYDLNKASTNYTFTDVRDLIRDVKKLEDEGKLDGLWLPWAAD